jgi:hypothetical protein
MKRTILAAALLAAAPFALAQATDAAKPADAVKAPDIPKPNCGTAPELPGRTIMQDTAVRKRFEGEVQKYKECMKAYVDERQAAARAHTAAGNEAVNGFNAWVKSLDDEQKKRRGGDSTEGGAAPSVRTY